jgi:trimethylamine---corrinoid protein Co-methyltransferase
MGIVAGAVAVAGSEAAFRARPNFIFFTAYESPLKLAHDPIANVLSAAAHGIPVVYLGGPTIGLKSPFTGASVLVIHLATVLCALTIVQLKCPGVPSVLGSVPSMMDLRSGRPAYGSPEMSLHSAAAVDLARYCMFLSWEQTAPTKASCSIHRPGLKLAFRCCSRLEWRLPRARCRLP